ncbi:unnamed protein product [Lepeophtheirus salmonis]|uniref:(salmon louse) hypothetical protein n=1 Tax=Lepeophtheirus salmonis TaxID=72036 RepID=A0A7R8CMN4_LEPSM|nr:unnamed protein product [Lepeophtheirus salmonis]CAF2867312.1 unnamed protein product [Lepeophtheirus salmonis]
MMTQDINSNAINYVAKSPVYVKLVFVQPPLNSTDNEYSLFSFIIRPDNFSRKFVDQKMNDIFNTSTTSMNVKFISCPFLYAIDPYMSDLESNQGAIASTLEKNTQY